MDHANRFLSTAGICGCLLAIIYFFMVPVLVQKCNGDNEVGEYEKVCRNYWDDFKNKRSDLDAAFSQWKPSGEALVLHLRQSAEKLVSNRKWTASTEVLGATAALVGGVMLFNPITFPFGTILTLGGKIFRLLSQFVSCSLHIILACIFSDNIRIKGNMVKIHNIHVLQIHVHVVIFCRYMYRFGRCWCQIFPYIKYPKRN